MEKKGVYTAAAFFLVQFAEKEKKNPTLFPFPFP